MSAVILCFSARGDATARRLSDFGEVVRVPPGGLREAVASRWGRVDALVFVSSLGIAVRGVAPHLSDKASDPAVVVVSEDGRVVLPVTGAHLGGGSDLSERLASALGVSPILTTSSDRAGLVAPDLLASRLGWRVLGKERLAAVNGALLEAGSLTCWTDIPDLLPALPEEYLPADRSSADVLISPGDHPAATGVQLVPRCVTAGVGCRRGVPQAKIRSVLLEALRMHSLLPEAIGEIRTVDEKMDEPGLIELAAGLGVPLTAVPRDVIAGLGDQFSASAASRHLDLPGVAEPCAASAGRLLGPRLAADGVTVALSISTTRQGAAAVDIETGEEPERQAGSLAIIGTGPGDGGLMTLSAKRALDEADSVVGYSLYVDLLPPEWLAGKAVERYTMGEEEKRVERAVSLAEEGHRVALLSGGDPVLFGLAGLALRASLGRARATVHPGLTAVQATSQLLGAPYVNGVVLLSLSDYLQPWSAVERALEGAAASGLTVAVYNPVRREIDDKLAAVRRIFARHGYSRAYLVRDAGRPGQSACRLALSDLVPDRVDMRTLILLPGASAEESCGLLLDRRGYGRELATEGGPES
jgi:cobalt-precorrin 5A hydrolase/precorrin-3B C17-methyltransferase